MWVINIFSHFMNHPMFQSLLICMILIEQKAWFLVILLMSPHRGIHIIPLFRITSAYGFEKFARAYTVFWEKKINHTSCCFVVHKSLVNAIVSNEWPSSVIFSKHSLNNPVKHNWTVLVNCKGWRGSGVEEKGVKAESVVRGELKETPGRVTKQQLAWLYFLKTLQRVLKG